MRLKNDHKSARLCAISNEIVVVMEYASRWRMPMRLCAILRKFQREERGVTAIEFAVIAPVLMLLIFGIIEFALIMTLYNVMEGATSISARLGKTGFTAPGVTRAQTILDSITDRAGTLIDKDKLIVTSKFYKQYDQINDPEPYSDSNSNSNYDMGEPYTDINGNGAWDVDMGSSGYGSAGDVVVYKASYPWPIATPIMRELIGVSGNFIITTHAVVKNEPY
jgi:Flp pilus assembly pilin Flp